MGKGKGESGNGRGVEVRLRSGRLILLDALTSLRRRTMRKKRNMRRNVGEMGRPDSAIAVRNLSSTEERTSDPSRTFHPSEMYCTSPRPMSFIAISMTKAMVKKLSTTSEKTSTHAGWSYLDWDSV